MRLFVYANLKPKMTVHFDFSVAENIKDKVSDSLAYFSEKDVQTTKVRGISVCLVS